MSAANGLAGKTAIVTGASRGIGLAIAQRLVDDGARVVVTARKDEALQAAVVELGGPDKALGIAGRADDAEHRAGTLMDLDLDAGRKILEVNAIGTLAWTQQVVGAWMKEHGGAIVNVASVAGMRPAPGIGFYGASKALLIHLTEELAVELGPDIRVNAVAPAVVKTRFAEALYTGREDEGAAAYPLKRLGAPEDIAASVAHLLSDDAAWTTGQTLVLDGGLTLTGRV